MPRRPGKGPLAGGGSGRLDLSMLLSSPASLDVNQEALMQAESDVPMSQQAPAFTGKRAKFLGFIPYGEDPAKLANANLAYEQFSGTAENRRALELQKLLGPVLNEFAIAQHAAKNDLDVYKQGQLVPIEAERALGIAQGTFFGGQGGTMRHENIAAADDAIIAGLQNKALDARQVRALNQATFGNRLTTASNQAQQAANESRTRGRVAISPQGQEAIELGQIGQYVQPAATALSTARNRLGVGDVSTQPLAKLLGPYAEQYEYGAIPIEQEMFTTIPGKDGQPAMKIPNGTRRVLQLPAGQVDPSIIERARANLQQQRGNNTGAPQPVVPPATVPAPTDQKPPSTLPMHMQEVSNEYFGRANAGDALSALAPLANLLTSGRNVLEDIFAQDKQYVKTERERAKKSKESNARRKELQKLLSDYYE